MKKWESESLAWIHEVRRKIQEEEKGMSWAQIIARTKAETDPIIRELGLTVVPPPSARFARPTTGKPVGESFEGLLVRDRGKPKKSRTGR